MCTFTGEIMPFKCPDFAFRYRLLRHYLRPLNVGGAGDCFFKSVSPQLHSDQSHLDIRAQGIKYLREHPERFIESIVNMSWA